MPDADHDVHDPADPPSADPPAGRGAEAERSRGAAAGPGRGPEAALPAWMAPAWTVVRDGPRVAVVRRDFGDSFRRLGLIRAADPPPAGLSDRARPFRPAGGRGELALVPADPLGEAVVRPYRRGGLVAGFVESRYLLGDRAFRELELTLRLRRAGVPAVEPLAAVQSARRPGYRAALVTRFVADAPPAPEALRAPRAVGEAPAEAHGGGDPARGGGRGGGPGADARDALRRMGRATRALHEAGGHHPDLNAHNFLLPADRARPAVLLDFDRARKLSVPLPRPLARWSVRRLRRSLAKLGLERALEAWDAFGEGYAAAPRDGG